jgi:peptide/nickel transport system permease protein
MLTYLIRRILLFIPTLIVISLVAFIISTSAPGDPVERMLNLSEGTARGIQGKDREIIMNQKRHELGLDLPLFYFSINKLAEHQSHPSTLAKYVPVIRFYGLHNQYHRWISNIVLHGDFGVSYQTQLPVMDEIRSKLPWSLTLTLLSVILAFGLSIPVGLYAARYRNRFFDKASATVLFMMYSLPNFFVATLLLVFFANPQFFNWFPESGVQDVSGFNPDWNFFIKLQHWAPYLMLPLIAYTYSSIAFLSRQMRAGAVETYEEEYIKTARAKGLSENRILWKYVFRNSLMPMITIFAHVFPAAIVGSIIIETIFAIPGMGREIYEAILSYDYPVIVAVFTIFGFLTLVGYLVSDILYALVDPRISYSKR